MSDVEINLKDNIFYKSYKDKMDLNEEIINFIFSNKIDKVLYKGDPKDINYKLLKKVIPMSEKKIEPDMVREKYSKIIDITDNEPYCVIYKR